MEFLCTSSEMLSGRSRPTPFNVVIMYEDFGTGMRAKKGFDYVAEELGNAIDDVRAAETKELMRMGKEVVLKYSRWCFLKNPENLTENQKVKLKDLLKCNLKTIRAYLLKEDFQAFWDYVSPVRAVKFLDQWCAQVMRSRLEPMKVAKTIRAHKQLILSWFEAKNVISLGVVEGQNKKALFFQASSSLASGVTMSPMTTCTQSGRLSRL
jgi:transposase